RTELHRLIDRNVERNDAAGDLVETGEHCRRIYDALRRRFNDHRIAWLRCRIRRLRGIARRIGTGRQRGWRLTPRNGRAPPRLAPRGGARPPPPQPRAEGLSLVPTPPP